MSAPGPYGRCTDGCLTCAANPLLPPVDLDDYKTGRYDEWHYGTVRGPWQSYPVVAQPAADGAPFTLTVSGHMELGRDELPGLIAWLTAVYAATEPTVPACDCATDTSDHLPFCTTNGAAS